MRSDYWVWDINPEPWRAAGIPRWGHPVKDGKLMAYQQALAEELPDQNPHFQQHLGNLHVEFFFWRSSAHGQPADATNLMKATEDALQGILYINDKHNRHVESILVDQTPKTEPLILVRISPWRPTSIPARPVRPALVRTDTWQPPDQEMF